MAEHDWRPCRLQRMDHGFLGRVREVDQHAKPVHLPHHALAVRAQSVPERRMCGKCAVRVLVVAVVVKRNVADAELVVEPQCGGRVADHVQALNAHG